MLNKESLLSTYTEFREGLTVETQDGHKLGKVVTLESHFFTVEKGIFFPREFTLRYDDIADIRDGVIYLNLAESELKDWKNESYQGWTQVDQINQGQLNATPSENMKDRFASYQSTESPVSTTTTTPSNISTSEDIKVPVVEEELEAQKVFRQVGEIKVRKVVHTELRHFTVPVMREEIRIERVPVSGSTDTLSSASTLDQPALKDSTVTIPIREEEIEIHKRQVVKEEIRVRKDQVQEQREVSGEVRKEEVHIEGEEALRQNKRKIG